MSLKMMVYLPLSHKKISWSWYICYDRTHLWKSWRKYFGPKKKEKKIKQTWLHTEIFRKIWVFCLIILHIIFFNNSGFVFLHIFINILPHTVSKKAQYLTGRNKLFDLPLVSLFIKWEKQVSFLPLRYKVRYLLSYFNFRINSFQFIFLIDLLLLYQLQTYYLQHSSIVHGSNSQSIKRKLEVNRQTQRHKA